MKPPQPRAVVMGLGRFGGGVAVTRHLVERGYQVTVTDRAEPATLTESLARIADLDVRLVLGGHVESDFESAHLVIANPAVPPNAPLLALARKCGARIRSELELLLEAVPARVVLITGTQGKSSSAALLAGYLERGFAELPSPPRVYLGGNIGRSLLPELGNMRAEDVCVIEISSYQLEALGSDFACARVEVVAITNVLLDHLERHGSPARYAAAKARVLTCVQADGVAILPGDDERLWSADCTAAERWAHGTAAARCSQAASDANGYVEVRDERFAWSPAESASPETLHPRTRGLGVCADLPLPLFQRANALVALGAAYALGVPAKALAASIEHSRGLPHRLEDLGLVAGHRVWNNAISTTPDSTVSALRSTTGPLTWLCGGAAKELPTDELASVAAQRCRRAIVFGRDELRLNERFVQPLTRRGLSVQRAESVEQAVALAFELMDPDEALLFSPACASFDAYANFSERADAFRAALPAPSESHTPSETSLP